MSVIIWKRLYILWIFLIGTVFSIGLLSSCTPDELEINLILQIGPSDKPSAPKPEGVLIQIDYPADFLQEIAGSRAYGIISVMDRHTSKEVVRIPFYPHNLVRNGDLALQLPSGEYAFLVWVDYRTNPDKSFYNTDDLQQVTVRHLQGDGVKEAYAACACLKVDENQSQHVYLPLTMPVARYNFLLEEIPETYVGKTVLVQQMGYYPIVYNVLEGKCTSAVLNPKWLGKARTQSDGKICLLDGVQFVHADTPSQSTFNLFMGNEQGNLQYECDGVILHLERGKRVQKVMHQEDFWQYTEGNIIDGDFSGDIDIEIK